MVKKVKQVLSMILVVVMLITMLPTVSLKAAELPEENAETESYLEQDDAAEKVETEDLENEDLETENSETGTTETDIKENDKKKADTKETELQQDSQKKEIEEVEPVEAKAEDPEISVVPRAQSLENGLFGEWYKAREGAQGDINRYEFLEENLLDRRPIDNLNGNSLRDLIRDILGKNDDVQEVLASFTGELDVLEEGDYTFHVIGDDGFKLIIDGQPIIEFWELKWEIQKESAPIHLTKGRHDIRVEYLQGHGGAWLKMEWSSDTLTRQIVPKENLFRKKESYYSNELDSLKREIVNCEAVYEKYADVAEAEVLKAAIDTAQEVVSGDYVNEDLESTLSLLETTKSSLIGAKTNVYIGTGVTPSEEFTQFRNPLYQGQDPMIAQKDGFYYYVASSNDDAERKIYISKSRTLTDQGEKKEVINVVGKQGRVFAPELFFFEDENDEYGGRWYIYYCADVHNFANDYPHLASEYTIKNEHHIGFCARSKTDDPLGEWNDPEPLYLGEDGEIHGANDLTVFEHNGSYFAVWGTLGPNEPAGPAIVEMDNPYTITKERKMLPIGGGEGPRTLRNDQGDLFITMSEGDYQSNGYRLSLLSFKDNSVGELSDFDKFLDAGNWTAKRDVFVSSNTVSGPARASFVKSPDNQEDWMIFHSRVFKEVGRNSWRQINIKKFDWNADGTPDFGIPLSPNKTYDLPAGDPGQGTVYQAENGILEKGAVIKNENLNYSGDAYVHIPNKKGAAISFVVNADQAGDYIVGARYAYGIQKDRETTHEANIQLPSRASMNIYVNGNLVEGKFLMDKTTFTWNECFTGSRRLSLEAGKNLITYTVEAGCVGDVYVDYISMHQADEPFMQAEVVPKSISLDCVYSVLKPKETIQISPIVNPSNAVNKNVTYSSADSKVAKVDSSGKVTAVAEGRTLITITSARNAKVQAEYMVVVTKQEAKAIITPVYIEFATKAITLQLGQNKNLAPKVYPANAADKSVKFTSSNTKVATVDAQGKITAKAAGKATIKAVASADKSVIQSCNVTVPQVKKVTKITAKRDGKKGYAKITWKKTSDVVGYKVYRSTKKNKGYKLIKTIGKASTTSYTDKKAKKNKVYYYRVKAYRKVGSQQVLGSYSPTAVLKKYRVVTKAQL